MRFGTSSPFPFRFPWRSRGTDDLLSSRLPSTRGLLQLYRRRYLRHRSWRVRPLFPLRLLLPVPSSIYSPPSFPRLSLTRSLSSSSSLSKTIDADVEGEMATLKGPFFFPSLPLSSTNEPSSLAETINEMVRSPPSSPLSPTQERLTDPPTLPVAGNQAPPLLVRSHPCLARRRINGQARRSGCRDGRRRDLEDVDGTLAFFFPS